LEGSVKVGLALLPPHGHGKEAHLASPEVSPKKGHVLRVGLHGHHQALGAHEFGKEAGVVAHVGTHVHGHIPLL